MSLLVGILGFILLILLIFVGVPVYLSMIIIGLGGNLLLTFFNQDFNTLSYLLQFKTLLWGFLSNLNLVVLPIFIFLSYLLEEMGISEKIFKGINYFFGRFKGGLGIATIFSAGFIGAVSGSSLATTSALGQVANQALKKYGYNNQLISGIIASAGTLGTLIPPSFVLIIYVVLVEASLVDMFKAAFIPALLALLSFSITTHFLVKKSAAPRLSNKKPSLKNAITLTNIFASLKLLLPAFLLFGLIFFSLFWGWFSLLEVASLGSLGMFIYGLIKKDLSIKKIYSLFLRTANYSALIYMILFGAEILKSFFTRSNLPFFFVESLTQLLGRIEFSWAPWLVLFGIIILLIGLGCFLESLTIILIFVPFFWPLLIEMNGGENIDKALSFFQLTNEQLKIWFGILMLIIVEIGLITPPLGLNLFILKKIVPSLSFSEIYLGVIPYIMVEIIRILLLLFFPFILFII